VDCETCGIQYAESAEPPAALRDLEDAMQYEWSRACGGVPVYVHADDRGRITRPYACVELWEGAELDWSSTSGRYDAQRSGTSPLQSSPSQ
jgi:hypothetical protein